MIFKFIKNNGAFVTSNKHTCYNLVAAARAVEGRSFWFQIIGIVHYLIVFYIPWLKWSRTSILGLFLTTLDMSIILWGSRGCNKKMVIIKPSCLDTQNALCCEYFNKNMFTPFLTHWGSTTIDSLGCHTNFNPNTWSSLLFQAILLDSTLL